MKHFLAIVTVLAMTAPVAHAEPTETQNKWRSAFAASAMVTAVGATMLYWGRERIDSMEHALCTDTYANDCGHRPPTSQAQVDDFNSKGETGQTVARAGVAVLAVGAVGMVVTGIMGFRHKESNVVVAPTITPQGGAGAAMMLRF